MKRNIYTFKYFYSLEIFFRYDKFLASHPKGTKPHILGNFLSTTFHDLKVIFGYIGESPENFMSKYTQGSMSISSQLP